jgi:hypothetical protein
MRCNFIIQKVLELEQKNIYANRPLTPTQLYINYAFCDSMKYMWNIYAAVYIIFHNLIRPIAFFFVCLKINRADFMYKLD